MLLKQEYSISNRRHNQVHFILINILLEAINGDFVANETVATKGSHPGPNELIQVSYDVVDCELDS